MRRSAVLALAAVSSLAGCGGRDAATAPTWVRDIAPIVHGACTSCHRPGGPAPFALLTHADAARRLDVIGENTRERRMPPWLPTHGDFLGDPRLSEAQLDLLQRWIAAGGPRGEGDEPAPPAFPSSWQLRQPDLVIEAPTAVSVPASGPDLLRNLVLPAPVDRVRFVAAVEIQPGNPAVHHAVLVVDTTNGSRQRDARDAEPGFPGMALGSAKPPDGYFLGWTPGKRVRQCRDGMAWRLVPGTDLVLQLHLTPTGKAEAVKPRIGLYFTEQPPTAITYPLNLFHEPIDLPPGARDVVVRDAFTLPVPVTVHSLYPHAHYLGRRMTVTATPPNGAARDLLRIERWDFDWQDDYTLREPLTLAAGTRIAFEYSFDNSADNPNNPSRPPVHVRSGPESTDEMATLALQVTVADAGARATLGEAAIRADLGKRGDDVDLLVQLATLLRDQRRCDEALQQLERARSKAPGEARLLFEQGACHEAAGRAADAERLYRECLTRDAAQNDARVQLANVLLRGGRADEAIPLYQAAIAQSPAKAALHNNLATAFLATNQLASAEQHFRTTLTLDATFFQAWFQLGRVLAATGRTAEAREALQHANALRPGDPRVQEALGGLR